MVKRIMAWFSSCRRKKSTPVEAQLTEATKTEALTLARGLFVQGVSVRALQQGEVASDVPEVGDEPLAIESSQNDG